jgi:hypothetical protein
MTSSVRHYQSNISKRLIIKRLDNQTQVYEYVCLIIKSLDTHVQKLNNQIDQYPQKSLMCYLVGEVEWADALDGV